MASQHSFDLPTSKADELNDMVAGMIEQLDEVEDRQNMWPRRPQRWFSSERLVKCHLDYRTRAIITRGLYIFYPTFILKCGLYYRQLMD